MNKQRLTIAIILCAIFLAPSARADIRFSSVGILEAESVKKFSGMHQRGVLLRYQVSAQTTSIWLPSTLDLTAGWLERGSDTASFISFGPTYRFDMSKRQPGRWFMDFGVHPTLIGQSRLGGKNLGGKVFFTSYLGV